MKTDFGRVLRNTSYLALAQVATRAAGFAYVLILARLLPAAEFGSLNVALSLLLVTDMVADLGLSRLALREFSRDPDSSGPTIAKLIPLRLVLSGAVCAGLIASGWLAGGAPHFVLLLSILGLSLLPSGLALLLESVLHASQRFAVVSLAHVGLSLGQVVLGSTVLLSGGGMLWVAASFTAAYVGFLAFLIRTVSGRRMHVSARIDVSFCRAWLVAALPYSMVGVIFALTLRTDLLVLGWFAGPATAGVYALAAKVVEAALLATIAFGTVLTPLFARYQVDSLDALRTLFLRATRFLWLLTVPCALAGMMLGPPILRVFLPSAFDGVEVPLRLMLAGFPCWVAYYLNASLLLGSDNQQRATAVLAVLALLQLGLGLLLIPRYGSTGAAASFALSGIVSWLGTTLCVEGIVSLRAVLVRAMVGPFMGWVVAMALMLSACLPDLWVLPAALLAFAAAVAAGSAFRIRAA